MNEYSDLTRWNRAGLTQFRYVDGNAIEYLEILRQQLVKQFSNNNPQWIIPAEEIPANEAEVKNETLIQRQERLSIRQKRITEMYQQDRRDWVWEITRTFARACHMLTEHSNAYSNEGFLGTAAQWEHVRRLVEMLDYHPAPPASASTQLVLQAKEGKAGLVAKGFQVKFTPENGGDKIIFETLDDVFVDSALNVLRPKGWNQSEEPVVSDTINNDNQSYEKSKEQLSVIAETEIIAIQGIGNKYKNKISKWAKTKIVKIKDFKKINPDETSENPGANSLLWEFKAKADILLNFSPAGNWSKLYKTKPDLTIADISKIKTTFLAKSTGNTVEQAQELKLDIEIIELCLDQDVYRKTKFTDLFVFDKTNLEIILTPWLDKGKPNIVSNDVAMVYRTYNDNNGKKSDEAKAVSIALIDKQSKAIYVKSIVNQTWLDWTRSEAQLMVSPKWKRKCWLNGVDVIRTAEPHGFSIGSFICWKIASGWKFAEVIDADKRNIRLKLNDAVLPENGTPLYDAIPVTTKTMAANLDAIGMLAGDLPEINDIRFGESVESEQPVVNIPFTIEPPDYSASPDILSPPGALSMGSFLFPTPMLPMDLVKLAVELMLSMGVMVIPSTGEIVFKSLPELNTEMPLADELYEMLDIIPNISWVDGTKTQIIAALDIMLSQLPKPLSGESDVKFKEILAEIEQTNPLIAVNQSAIVKAVVMSNIPRYIVEGKVNNLAKGDWVIAQFTDEIKALKIDIINEYEDIDNTKTFSIIFDNISNTKSNLKIIYVGFQGKLIAEGATVNKIILNEAEIELENVPARLKVGHSVLHGCDAKSTVLAKVEKINGNKITFNPPPRGCTKGSFNIFANIVTASHGKTQPAKILGSGDATQSNQAFTLEVNKLTFTSDSSMSSGVAAAIDVEVEGRTWQQVSTLRDSSPSDHHYSIRMTEQAYAKIIFGDGENGRRLPTGKNNIRVRYRVGNGIAGNVPAGGLEKPVNPHAAVERIRQPIAAAGGGDMEDINSLRKNAPPTLLTLERAVSLSDFTHLAASQSSIWQAKAYLQIAHGGQTEIVRVIVVPAGGVESIQVNETLRIFLQKHAMPGIKVLVDNYCKETFSLNITLRVITDAFVAVDVIKDVELALKEYFILKNRQLGENLYLSEVIKIVEAVKGVENSICILNNNEKLQVIKAIDDSTVLCLDTEDVNNPSILIVSIEEYAL